MNKLDLENANKISEEINKLQDELDRAEKILVWTNRPFLRIKVLGLFFNAYYGFNTTKEESTEILQLLISNRKQRIDELNKRLDSL